MPVSSSNFVLIMSDQHHPRFMGCAGEPILSTPHLDSLATRGARFTNVYCNFPLCCPSRMSFMSARYASEIGCLSNHSQLGSDVPTFAHAFNAAGYETVLCGRMHFNGPDQRHGFQKRIVGDLLGAYENHGKGLERVLGPILKSTTGPSANAIATSGAGYSGYQAYDETVASRAAEWLRERSSSSQPFLLVVGLVMPHAPFVATPEDYARYDELIGMADLPAANPDVLHPALRAFQRRARLEDADEVALEDQRRARVAYYGMCAHVDRLVGRIFDALNEAGLSDNTNVIYTSDHGEQLGEHGMWWKHTFYEASVGVPLLMAGPDLPRDVVVDGNVSLLDIGPTLLDFAGAPAIPNASGRSFRCLLDNRRADWHDTVIAENMWPPASPELQRMLKRGDWKLCHYPGEAPQLFDLANDPGENDDRATDLSCRHILDEMMQELLAGWDYEAIMAQRERSLTIEAWTQQWRESCDLPEPDAPWFEEPPLNRLEHSTAH